MSGLATGLEFIWALVLMLGVLITVHEFGHFVVAKWCGVKVLKFSIGFGPAIGFGRYRLAWTRGETEYVIAWFPLGGFVKMLGEIPGEEATPETQAEWDRSMGAQPVWKKLAIVMAGPAMNLALPVVVLVGFYWIGSQQPVAQIGTVDPDSPAAQAGLQPGDRILAVDGEPVSWWREIAERIEPAQGRSLALEVERGDEDFDVTVGVVARTRLDAFLAQDDQGWIGIQPTRQPAVLGVVSLMSPAAGAGLRSGDRVLTVAATEVEDWPAFVRAYEAAKSPVVLRLTRGDDEAPEVLEETVPGLGSVDRLGVIPAVVLIDEVTSDGAARRAGLRTGDLILAVDGEQVASWLTFRETVMASGGRSLSIQYARDGDIQVSQIAPKRTVVEIDGNDFEQFLIGIQGSDIPLPPVLALERYTDPRESFPRAVGRVAEHTVLVLEAYRRILTGQVSRKALGGPIEIARRSHQALQAGWDAFLALLMYISINLAVLNLLPIPILDGGQAVIYSIEGIKRSAVSVRTREFAQVAGLFVILSLMGVAFWNDISKYWSSFVDWLIGS